ncbi:PPC domain-containing protein [Tenacibaculum geojense]|uniref:PPC domain-containing protein n=1 Tax=Tenacibaculum geojense TaxID=915352 RepID=A0ABW3JQD5_9FLAO
MRKSYHFITLFILLILTACSSDEKQPNVAPDPVTGINVEIISETMVNLSWNASDDLNNDEVTYNVVVNDMVLANRTSSTSIQFDVEQFIELNRSSASRGVGLELIINISAFDNQGNVSEGNSVNRYVYVNRNPGEFELINVQFDFYNYSNITVEWSPADDADRDILSYNIYLNDEILFEDYIIGSNGYMNYGSVYANYDYRSLINEDITVSVVANDRSGGTRTVSQTFNFSASDQDLGLIESFPYSQNVDIMDLPNEADNKILYRFEVNTDVAYQINTNNYNVYLNILDENLNIIRQSSYDNISGFISTPGVYYIEVFGYNNLTISQEMSISLTEVDLLSDYQDLGLLNTPFLQTYEYSTVGDNDTRIRAYFEVTNSVNYDIEITQADYDTYLFLYDENGNLIASNDDGGNGVLSRMTGSLNPGNYYIEVGGYGNGTGSGILSVQLN